MAVPTPSPKGLLSCLYNVTYDPDVRKRFHADPDRIMENEFGLPKEVRDVMKELGGLVGPGGGPSGPKTGPLLDRLMDFLKAQLTKDVAPTFW